MNYVIFFLIFSLSLITCQDTPPIQNKETKTLNLDDVVTGKIDTDNTIDYYTLKIPEEFEQGKVLVFSVKESRKGIKEGEEIFSDPDIYISKSNKYPKNREESDWFSERYGSDILTIPSYAVSPGDEFFIGMYCQYKCRYELQSYVTKEVQIELGKIYHFTLTVKESLSYALYVPENNKKEELNIIANNPGFQNFKIYVATDSPSSQNTFQVIPSWIGGYMISIDGSNNKYCTDCYYHILLLTAEEEVNIQLSGFFASTVTELKSGVPVSDAVKANKKRCYSFDMRGGKDHDSQLLIQTSLFSGAAIINISGWKENLSDDFTKIRNDKFSFTVESNNNIMLTKGILDNFETFEGQDNSEKKLNFCVYGLQTTSYSLNAYFLSEAQNLQRYNMISPGSELTGYLQAGQVTRYRVLDFNLNLNSQITLQFGIIQGNPEYYVGFCSHGCFYSEYSLASRKERGELKQAEYINFGTSQFIIKPEENKCYLDRETKNDKCSTYAVVKCNGIPGEICAFKIQFSTKEQPLLISPKKTYYNIIPKGKVDLYEILVADEKVNGIVIVLTSVTGDAELTVLKRNEQNSKNEENLNREIRPGEDEKLVGMSKNRDYIPDVVRITPAKLNSENVVGKYIIKISSTSFSSYNLYYYTTKLREKYGQPSLNDITTSLTEGKIISDYFPNDLEYKVYMYTPDDRSKKDIKFLLTTINAHFSFKVFLDFNKISFNYDTKSTYEERVKNYDWSSDMNNELTISKDDKKYSENGPYYIVVIKSQSESNNNEEFKMELDAKAVMMYYIGVTKKGIPFTLSEGIEQTATLNENYNYQNYWYIHKDINEPFQLEVNVLNGEVDVFVDVKELSEENITNIYQSIEEGKKFFRASIYTKLGISNYGSIELFKNYFVENKFYSLNYEQTFFNQSSSMYIYVVQSRSSKKFQKDSQYIITAKSSISTGKILLSGKVYYGSVLMGNEDHYIIDEVRHRKGSTINVRFTNGNGDIFVRIPETPETGKNIVFPNGGLFDYRAEDSHMGKIVSIPAKVYDRINSKSLKLQILISVIPTNKVRGDMNDGDYVEYSISYSSEAKRISQNIPYQSYISSGEYQYYTFYFDSNTENIYISLSNMNGDADMYLNYGNEVYPTPYKYDWFSSNTGHEYIDINKNDGVLKRKELESLAGYYTLLVVGYTDTTYTLFVSSHENNILTLIDNTPVSCRCQSKGDKCFFRYDDVLYKGELDLAESESKEKSNVKNEIITTFQYIYGNGRMYASIYKDQDLISDRRTKYQQYFPTEKNYQFSNVESGKRNFMKIETNERTQSKDALILMTYICEEKTDVEITTASLNYKGIYRHIDIDRENIYYLKFNESKSYTEQPESTLTFYSRRDEDLIYEFHVYTGRAKIKIYTNETYWDRETNKLRYDYNHIAEFHIRGDNDGPYYRSFQTYTESYFNSISKLISSGKLIYFNIKPSSDFGFYLQVNYDRSWINVPLGKDKTYLVNKNQMYGYFDIYEDFSNIEMSISLEDFSQKTATVYVKVLVVDKKKARDISSSNIEDKLYHQEIPSKNNFDYEAKTTNYLGAVSININSLPIIKDEEKDEKIVRALFSIRINKQYIRVKQTPSYPKDSSTTERTSTPPPISQESTVHITITPGVNNFKRIDLSPNNYYFSNTSLIPKSQGFFDNYDNNQMGYTTKSYDGSKEIKIYTLNKKSKEDKVMLVKISTCSGKYDVKASSKIVDYDNNQNDIPIKERSSNQNADNIVFDNSNSKNIYLSIKTAEKDPECNDYSQSLVNPKCFNELSYLISYYSLTPQEYKSKEIDVRLEFFQKGNNEIVVIIPKIQGIDLNNKFREKEDIEYNVFWTKNVNYTHYLETMCHLSSILNQQEFNETTDFHVIRNAQLTERNEYVITDSISDEEKVWVNVLSRNLKTNELVAYLPVQVQKARAGWGKIILIIFICILIVLASYYIVGFLKEKFKGGFGSLKYGGEPDFNTSSSRRGGYSSVSLENY